MACLKQIASGINGPGWPTSEDLEFDVEQTSGALLDELARRLADERWKIERRGDSLACDAAANGGAPTYMSIFLLRSGRRESAEHAADWTWGLSLERP